MVGALIGAILAIPTGLWLDRRIKLREQEERANTVLRTILDELQKNKNEIEKFLAIESTEDDIRYPLISDDAWQAAQEGVQFGLSDYLLHKRLITVYEQIGFVNQIAQSLWNMFFNPASDFGLLDKKVNILKRVLRDETQQLTALLDEAITNIQNTLNTKG